MKTLLLLLLSAVPAFGRLGETIDQSIARYGSPQTSFLNDDRLQTVDEHPCPDCEERIFVDENMQIRTFFYKGKCCFIEFLSLLNQPFTSDQQAKILDENSQGKTWGVPMHDPTNDGVNYTRWDGGYASVDGYVFQIAGPDYQECSRLIGLARRAAQPAVSE